MTFGPSCGRALGRKLVLNAVVVDGSVTWDLVDTPGY
jgi:hypothetical protein